MLRRGLENAILKWLSERPMRHVRAVSYRAADGLLRRVYDQAIHDYILAGPITVLSVSPELTAGLWMYGRETVLAAEALDRGAKEAIAAAVSVINECPYCRDMHASMTHSAGAHDLADAVLGEAAERGEPPVIAWARASRSPGAAILAHPPFTAAQRPEAIGTAVFFHYINRVVNVFFEDTALRLPLIGAALTERLTRAFGFGLRPRMNVPVAPGASLDLLPEATLPDDLAWADHPTIGPAVARWAAALEAAAERHVPAPVRAAVEEAVGGWNGKDPSLGSGWLEEATPGLAAAERPAAELALLAAMASYRVTDDRIAAFADRRPGAEALLTTVAWGSGLAARRIGTWLAGAEATGMPPDQRPRERSA